MMAPKDDELRVRVEVPHDFLDYTVVGKYPNGNLAVVRREGGEANIPGLLDDLQANGATIFQDAAETLALLEEHRNLLWADLQSMSPKRITVPRSDLGEVQREAKNMGFKVPEATYLALLESTYRYLLEKGPSLPSPHREFMRLLRKSSLKTIQEKGDQLDIEVKDRQFNIAFVHLLQSMPAGWFLLAALMKKGTLHQTWTSLGLEITPGLGLWEASYVVATNPGFKPALKEAGYLPKTE